MSLELDRDDLAAVLRHVANAVEARNTIPILSHLLLETAYDRLTVTGTNLDLMASASCAAIGDMSLTVDAGKLAAAIDSLRPGKLTITAADNGRVTVKQGRSVRTLPTLPAADFPKRKPVDDATRFTIGAAALVRLLDTCHVAMSTEETRYYLCGVFLHVAEDRLRAAATDGHRLIRAETSLPAGVAELADAIVPTKAVLLLRRMLAKVTADVDVTISRTAIAVRVGNTEVNSKLIDGTFPDYSRVIPPVAPIGLTIGRTALVDAVRSVTAMVAEDKTRVISIDLAGSDGPEARAMGASGASACEPLEGTANGKPFKFGLNGVYARSVAELFAEDATLTMTIADAAAPMLIGSDKDPDVIAVIMPMRV